MCVAMMSIAGGCATVTRGTDEAWTVTSVPSSASVTTSNGFSCDATPCTFKMEHKAEFEVTVSKAGYKSYHGHVIHQVSTAGGAGMAGNVLVGGLIGMGVDAATGAMMELKPNPLAVTLDANDPPAVSAAAPPPVVSTPPAPPQATGAAGVPAAPPSAVAPAPST
jgi:hypothetical protein